MGKVEFASGTSGAAKMTLAKTSMTPIRLDLDLDFDLDTTPLMVLA